MGTITIVIIGVIGVVVGCAIGFFAGKGSTKSDVEKIEADEKAEAEKKISDAKTAAEKIVADANRNAENTKKDKQLEAKEHFLQLKAKNDQEVAERTKKLVEKEAHIKQQQVDASAKMAE